LKAFVSAFAIGAEVNEYAWTRISDLAALICSTMFSVHPPLGEKQTFVMSACKANAVVATKLKIRNDKTVVVILFMDFFRFFAIVINYTYNGSAVVIHQN
jgi:hypothetical protein